MSRGTLTLQKHWAQLGVASIAALKYAGLIYPHARPLNGLDVSASWSNFGERRQLAASEGEVFSLDCVDVS